jgi:hypothetical protein
VAEPSLAEQMATLKSTLRGIEVRLAFGRPPVEGLEEFKTILDDMRHRLWGLLSTTGNEYRSFQERFRIRRATELCRILGRDLLSGSMSARHPELPQLQDSAVELGESIEHARRRST